MPALTPNRSYPYPLSTDPADGPEAIQALAEAVDDDITANLEPATRERVYGSMRGAATQAILPNVETTLGFQVQLKDTDDMINVVSSPTIIRINTDGFYAFHGYLTVSTTLNWTNIISRFRLNGAEMYSATQHLRTTDIPFINWSIQTSFPCVAGDAVTMTFSHNSPATTMSLHPDRQFDAWRMAT